MSTFTPLTVALKNNLSVNTGLDWTGLSQQTQATISADEFVAASSSYPLFFTKNSHNGSFSAIALLGLLQDNIFFDGQPSHHIAYIPKSLSMLPFALGSDPENTAKLVTCINLQSELINAEEGSRLLNSDMSSTERLVKINEDFSEIFQNHVNTEHFISALIEQKLLMELELNVASSDGGHQIAQGLYTINEQQLNSLPDKQKLMFLERGYYPPIMAMLASLSQVNRMIKLYETTKHSTISSVNMKAV